MDLILTIDQGNTAVKYSVFDDAGTLLRTASTRVPDLDSIASVIGDSDIRGAIYASVAGLDVRFIESLRCLCSENLLVLTPHTPLPLTNSYETPDTLGADRIAAAAGAVALYPHSPILVADAGSALTCDLIDDKGAFCGGIIAPGINMRMKALNAFTSRLPLPEWNPCEELTDFPRTTRQAIISGAVNGVAAQIRQAYLDASASFPGCRLIITGGDALPLSRSSLLSDLNPLCQPALVALGLNSIFRYNETLS